MLQQNVENYISPVGLQLHQQHLPRDQQSAQYYYECPSSQTQTEPGWLLVTIGYTSFLVVICARHELKRVKVNERKGFVTM